MTAPSTRPAPRKYVGRRDRQPRRRPSASLRAGHGYWVATGPSGPPLPPNSGSGRRIVYSNSQQRLWLVEANGVVSHTYLVSGKHGLPVGRRASRVFEGADVCRPAILTLPWTLRFANAPERWQPESRLPRHPARTRRHSDRTRLTAGHAGVARLRPDESSRRRVRVELGDSRHDRCRHRPRLGAPETRSRAPTARQRRVFERLVGTGIGRWSP